VSKTCPYCDGGAPFTAEHVIPTWCSKAITALYDSDRIGNIRTGSRGERVYQSIGLQQTTTAFCKACEGGWMREMEDVTLPILKPIIIGQNKALSTDEQGIVATWAYKTFLSLEQAQSGTKLVTPAEHHRFFRERQPSATARIWLGTYAGEVFSGGTGTRALSYLRQRIVIPNNQLRLTEPPHGYIATFHVYCAYFHLFDHFGGDGLEVAPINNEWILPIWPRGRRTVFTPLNWRFTDESIRRFPTKPIAGGLAV
jgi:hypothetical protein